MADFGITEYALIISAIGTGVSVYSQQQAASNAAAMAQYNYALQSQQIAVQTALAQQQADANASLAEYQAGIQNMNAESMVAQAKAVQQSYLVTSEADKRAGALAASRERDNARAFLAQQAAKAGASGFALAGTPLDSLADAAGILELKAQDVFQQGENEARKATELGDVESYRLRGQGRNESLAAAGTLYQAAVERWNGQTAVSKAKLESYGAEINRIDGMNTAAGYRMASYGTLFSGLSNMGSAYSSAQYYGAFKSRG